MVRTKKRNLVPYFFLLIFILLLVLTYYLKQQKVLFDPRIAPMVSAWDSIIEHKNLEKEFGFTYVRFSKKFSHRVYEFLYPRRYTSERVIEKVTRLLSDRGINTGKISIRESGRDVTFMLGSENKLFAELICTADMSTYAGKICLIIDDFGYNLNGVVQSFLEMDISATFAVLPGHAYTRKVADLADKAGFEVMVHMPMESRDYRVGEDRFILKRGLTKKEIRQRLRNALLEIPQAKGVNNHQGSSVTESRRMMKEVAEVLKLEGKYFVDSRTSARSVVVDQMKRADVLVAERTVFIDYEDNQEVVKKQMKLLEKSAREMGIAIGIAHPRENTLKVFQREIPLLKDEGFDFVFASEVVH